LARKIIVKLQNAQKTVGQVTQEKSGMNDTKCLLHKEVSIPEFLSWINIHPFPKH
jgi:hypothetical protein